ncbi:MAG: chromate efflux transporter [Acidobacteria bacterium]|nr:chromate efflux transporter [Acidobacteriota bacterium]
MGVIARNSDAAKPHTVPFRTAFRYWVKLGFINFGGPAGQIALMHTDLVERKRWISEERFLHALNYCMLLPGPEAQQLAIYIGWLLHGLWGGIVAGAFFIIPSIFVLLALSWTYAACGQMGFVVGILDGFKPAVIAVVAYAVYRIGQRALKNSGLFAVSAAAFISIYLLKIPFPLIVLGAGLFGLAASYVWPSKFAVAEARDSKKIGAHNAPVPVLSDHGPTPEHARPSSRRGAWPARIVAVGLALWIAPLLALVLGGAPDVVTREYLFFSKAALVTFGGAYAVLAYVAQEAVAGYHWLQPGQMIDGLALAETTPGPLIMVVQFVGFMGGWKFHGSLSAEWGGILGALLTTYVTFLPSFLFIFLGAPHIEQLRGNVKLNAALSGITAAVVGVILNLAVFLGTKVIFVQGGIHWFSAILAALSLLALTRGRLEIVWVVLAGGTIGLARTLIRSSI